MKSHPHLAIAFGCLRCAPVSVRRHGDLSSLRCDSPSLGISWSPWRPICLRAISGCASGSPSPGCGHAFGVSWSLKRPIYGYASGSQLRFHNKSPATCLNPCFRAPPLAQHPGFLIVLCAPTTHEAACGCQDFPLVFPPFTPPLDLLTYGNKSIRHRPRIPPRPTLRPLAKRRILLLRWLHTRHLNPHLRPRAAA
jgi:hypothetical protein